MQLIVTVKPQETGLELAAFPFQEGQFVEGESAATSDRVNVVINLGEGTDTTAAQEQFLDTNDAVIEYEVRPYADR